MQANEFLVNETTDQLQRVAGVGVRADGSFVIAWESTSTAVDDGSSTDIYRREYFADGTPDGGENLVNTWTGGPQIAPVVARTTTGNYGIFWQGQGFGHVDGVNGRLYDVNLSDDPGTPSRIPVGDQFMVGVTQGFENSSPAIAINTDGTFSVAFETFEEDGSGYGIFTERFNADGTAIPGSRVQVNTTATDDQSSPAIATDGVGNMLIVWQSKDSSGYGIFGQWFDAAGNKAGSEFQVNTESVGDQSKPDIAMDATGRAVVTWQSAGQDGGGLGIYYVRLAINATSGTELLANVTTIGDQQAPSVAASAVDGQFVIVWQGAGPLVEGEASIEVFGRRFDTNATPGAEFQVNSESLKDQTLPDVAMDATGDAIIVWQAEGQQGSGSDVYGRRMNDTGTLLDVDFIINSTTLQPQRSPAVSMNAAGDFLVAWQSQHQDGYSWGVYGHEYDASGATVVDEFVINERVAGPQTSPGVTVNASGQTLVAWLGNDVNHHPAVSAHRYLIPNTEPTLSVGTELVLVNYVGLEEMPPAAAMNAQRESVVAWVSYAEDGSGLGVFAQMLDRFGLPIGSRIAVNTFTAGNQGFPAVARNASGEFVITWDSEGEDGDGYGVYAQRYAMDGTPLGGVFQVNTTTALDQTRPTVAMAADGSFVIAWESVSGDGSLDIMAQRYAADGSLLGTEFQVNTFTGLDQKDAAIAMNATGQFVIAWVSDHPALSDPLDTEKSIFVQSYDASGNSSGPEVLVHRYVKDAQEAPALGIDASGRFVIGWQSINQDGNSWGVFARTFENDKTPIDRGEYVVNESRQGPQRYVGVGVDDYGRFVITWQTNSQAELAGGGNTGSSGDSATSSSWDVYSRQYGFDGRHEGGEILVTQWQLGPQVLPVVAQAPAGDFGIFWLGQGPDHLEGVHGRLYQSAAGTVGNDAFVLTYDGTAPTGTVTVTVSTDGGPVENLGTFPLSLELSLDGLGGTDSVRIVGTAISDTMTVTGSGLNINGANLFLTSIEERTLDGGDGDDQYRFNTDSLLGVYAIDEQSGGIDTLDFSLTAVESVSINLNDAALQVVNANLSLDLNSAAAFENASGGSGNDVLTGNNLNNLLVGNVGNDLLNGGWGDDVLRGGHGDDSYVFGTASAAEADTVIEYATGGVDTLTFVHPAVDVTLSLSTSEVQNVHTNRTLKLNSGNTFENASGSSGNDVLTGNSLNNLLIGNGGNDSLNGSWGNDVLRGGLGDDSYVFGTAPAAEADTVIEYAAAGVDTITFTQSAIDVTLNLSASVVQNVHTNRTLQLNSGNTFENASGSSGNDVLTGNSLDNQLSGDGGNDLLNGGWGNDVLRGGRDDDSFVFGTAPTAEADTVIEYAAAGVDTITFTQSAIDVTLNLSTTDVQNVHTNRTLQLNSGNTFENVFGNSGNDVLTGNSLNNLLNGDGGNDWLNGGWGNDSLGGGQGDDNYVFGTSPTPEADTVIEYAAGGVDTLSFVHQAIDITLNLSTSDVQNIHTNRTLKLNSGNKFENASGSSGNDVLTGNSLSNLLIGNGGNDSLNGSWGNDVLRGGLGDDSYVFGTAPTAEADEVFEDAAGGVDTLAFVHQSTDVTLSLNTSEIQNVQINRALQLNSGNTFENVFGCSGNDLLTGNSLDNLLIGNAGHDVLVGESGNDRLMGGDGRDLMIGGSGTDYLDGGIEDDVLISGWSLNDQLVANLNDLRAEWITSNLYADRIAALRTGVGTTSASLKSKINVFDEAGQVDVLIGGDERDWYFRAIDDVLSDLSADEWVDLL